MLRVFKTLKGYLACISATCAEMGSAFAVRDAAERNKLPTKVESQNPFTNLAFELLKTQKIF